jgi:uncharacterized protein (TIGR03086 family)
MSHPLIPLLERTLDEASRVLAAVPEECRDRPTPCSEWDVAHLASHLVSGVSGFADVGEGRDMPIGDEPLYEMADLRPTFDIAAARALAAWSSPGAAELTYPMPWGATPGDVLIGFFLIEVVVHAWDVARAIGLRPGFDEEVVREAYRLATTYADESTRNPQMFGPEIVVDSDAPTLDRLVGFLGREP